VKQGQQKGPTKQDPRKRAYRTGTVKQTPIQEPQNRIRKIRAHNTGPLVQEPKNRPIKQQQSKDRLIAG
jgi:hypothetical protein